MDSPNCFHQQLRCCATRGPHCSPSRELNVSSPIAQRLAWKFVVIVRSDCDVIFQWMPSDALAKETHHPSTSVTTFVHAGDVVHFHSIEVFDAYGRLGLPHVSLDHLRFPRAHRITLVRAFETLLNFFYDADLFTRL
ncbi:hypothetical protein MRX96_007247 [Rhipicephalus microplus]